MKALVGAFNQEKALVGAFSVIVQPVVEPMDRFAALVDVVWRPADHEDAHHHGEHLHYLPNIHKSAFKRVFCKELQNF